jgi:hypothetical protein
MASTRRAAVLILLLACSAIWAQENPVAFCNLLCPNGLPPAEMLQSDPISGHSCESLSLAYAQLSKEQCPASVSILQFDAVAFCCPAISPPNECSVCKEESHELLFPDQVLFAYGGHTCGSVQTSASFHLGDGCVALMDNSRADKNCRCGDKTPTIALATDDEDLVESNGGGNSRGGKLWWSMSFILAYVIAIMGL